MNFKTMLRKWHTYVGLIIAVPSIILSITGIYLIQDKSPKNALIAATICDDGAWVGVSSSGMIGNALSIDALPFPHQSVTAISCTKETIDVILDYGPIASTQRQTIRWKLTQRPFNGKARSIKRLENQLMVTTQTELWALNEDQWTLIKSFDPTLAQRIYEFHAGWFSGESFAWVWFITGIFWVVLTGSGIWVFFRMVRH